MPPVPVTLTGLEELKDLEELKEYLVPHPFKLFNSIMLEGIEGSEGMGVPSIPPIPSIMKGLNECLALHSYNSFKHAGAFNYLMWGISKELKALQDYLSLRNLQYQQPLPA